MSLSKLRLKLLAGFVSSTLVAAPFLFSVGTASADPTSTWSSTNSTSINLSLYSDFNNDGYLNSVSCITGTTCVAGGVTGGEAGDPMQLTGDASNWGVGGSGQSTETDSNDAVNDPLPTAGDTSLSFLDLYNLTDGVEDWGTINSISCMSTTSCVAVGQDSTNEPFVLTGDPQNWTSSDFAELRNGLSINEDEQTVQATLYSVSCLSDGWCTAVGSEGYSNPVPIEISGYPSDWKNGDVKITVLPLGSDTTGNLKGVSCVSDDDCVAVGNIAVTDSMTDTTTYYLLSFAGSPSTWNIETAIVTGTTTDNQNDTLNGVSCLMSSALFCVAVGTIGQGTLPVYLTGDPTPTTSDDPTTSPWYTTSPDTYALNGTDLGGGGSFSGVSCATTTYCVAVGSDVNSDGEPIVVSGDPSSWADDSGVNTYATEVDSAGFQGNFTSVSCTAVDTCVAVGHFYGENLNNVDDPGPFTAWITPPTQPSPPSFSYVPTLYPVTYLPGGGTGTPPTQASLNAGATFTVASPSALTYTGETFTGWSDGTTVYQPGATYTMPAAPVTLTAEWTPLPTTPASVTKPLLRTEVLFPFNKYYLTAQAKRQLNSFAKKIKEAAVTSFTVVGSTDLFGSEGYNIPLSEHRAHAVSAYLTAQLAQLGVTDVVFHDTWIGILKTQPTYTQNRRTVVAD